MSERNDSKRDFEIPGLYEHQGRYALLYDERFLRLFSAEPCSWLSGSQQNALKEMNEIVYGLTGQFSEMFLKLAKTGMTGRRYSDREDLSKLSADLIAFRIVYIFWNRMNSGPERYEVGFAKSGKLGRYLRALKEIDEIQFSVEPE